MSVAGILSSVSGYSTPNVLGQLQKQFSQLGKDLQSGSLSAAQTDYATLQQDISQGGGTSSPSSGQSSNPVSQALTQLSQDLQSGNLSGAQKDYATLQQDIQGQASQLNQAAGGAHGAGGHHHHHGGGDSDSSTSNGASTANGVSQLLSQIGQSLQSGNLSAAQQTYSTLQSSLQQFSQFSGQIAGAGLSSSLGGLSLSV